MQQSIVHIAIVVRDYDEALESYINKLDFVLIEDTYQPEQDKRWVVISPPGSSGLHPATCKGFQTGTRAIYRESNRWQSLLIPEYG